FLRLGALTLPLPCAKLAQTTTTPEAAHAPRRGQQIPDRERAGHRHGRAAAPLLASGLAVGGIAGSRRAAEEDRRDGRGTAGLPRLPRRRRRDRSALPA